MQACLLIFAMRKILIILLSLAACSTAFFAYIAATPPPSAEGTQIARSAPEPVQAQRKEPQIAVHIARDTIAAGTFMGPKHLRKIQVAASSSAAINGFTDAANIIGSIAAAEISSGQLLEPALLLNPSDPGFMAAAIRPGFRGVSVPVWREGTNAQVYRPGDVVDVILVATFPDRNDASPYQELNGKRTPVLLKDVASIVLSNEARILAVNDNMSNVPDPEAKAAYSTTIPMILEIADTDAGRVAMAAGMGKIYLLMQGDGAELMANPEEPLTAEELFPEYQSPGPTRGTVVIRGSSRNIEGYTTQNEDTQSDRNDSNDKSSQETDAKK